MSIANRLVNWLETHWVMPAYSGGVLAAVALCFFGAAVNTMAGWLYAISGLSFAILGIAAILPKRSLAGISIQRQPIQSVSAGDDLTVELAITNQTATTKTLLQVRDILPFVLGKPVETAIEEVAPYDTYKWVYYHPTQNRGVYRWQTLQLRTAAPLGLFWCRRDLEIPAKAVVYPTVLNLTHCPLVDEMGQEDSLQVYSQKRFQAATAGITRSLRPYRTGDPIRLIHWRTSARYGELRVRELEVITGGKEIFICLDSSATWQADNFESAVIAAASLYFYAIRQQLNVKLWTANTGLVQGDRLVLETLAAIVDREEIGDRQLPQKPIIWLTEKPITLNTLPLGSRWLLWQNLSSSPTPTVINQQLPGLSIQTEEPLQPQLQKTLV
ncbi:DUF58 domain-containing protein [Aliterella atlantica]|uniref:DUF58 domain-containing protein n=1 Tax=Aliterella atlantica CENA595 TaxID=1618023 RepID=A0A0D8ZX49_9CYAN|nr:DUF58 domain-containing protein [Aliterella atlantica]KJH73024.1 hypothetical protein UH38_02835 [Aliterella atlantica CENA595]